MDLRRNHVILWGKGLLWNVNYLFVDLEFLSAIIYRLKPVFKENTFSGDWRSQRLSGIYNLNETSLTPQKFSQPPSYCLPLFPIKTSLLSLTVNHA